MLGSQLAGVVDLRWDIRAKFLGSDQPRVVAVQPGPEAESHRHPVLLAAVRPRPGGVQPDPQHGQRAADQHRPHRHLLRQLGGQQPGERDGRESGLQLPADQPGAALGGGRAGGLRAHCGRPAGGSGAPATGIQWPALLSPQSGNKVSAMPLFLSLLF